MAKLFDRITDELEKFIQAQQMFFVATAPLSPDGHINLSPKGLDSFRILSPNRVAYLDLTGSGNETSAHLAENQRITFMFCAFQGKPLILRLYGKGQVLLPDAITPSRNGAATDWQTHADLFPAIPGTRQIIIAEIDRVQTSCGTGVPLYQFADQRSEMVEWAQKKGDRGMWDYWQLKNQTSVDGLPTPLSAWMERKSE